MGVPDNAIPDNANKQMELIYTWRIIFGMMLYAVALNGIVSINIITKNFDDIINIQKEKLKKIENKN